MPKGHIRSPGSGASTHNRAARASAGTPPPASLSRNHILLGIAQRRRIYQRDRAYTLPYLRGFGSSSTGQPSHSRFPLESP